MDDISKNIDFSRKNKVFSIQNPHMYLYSHYFPHIWVQFRNMFFLPYFTHFSFFCEKMKNHILYKTHKTKHFRIKFPICTYHFGNIKKNTIYYYIGKKRFFFRTFRKCTYRKNQTKKQFHLNNGENDYFSTSISRKINEIFQFHTMVTRLNSSTFWSVLSVWSWPPPPLTDKTILNHVFWYFTQTLGFEKKV